MKTGIFLEQKKKKKERKRKQFYLKFWHKAYNDHEVALLAKKKIEKKKKAWPGNKSNLCLSPLKQPTLYATIRCRLNLW